MLGLALLSTAIGRARATTAAEPVEAVLEIEHAPGAEACPNADAVFRSMKHLFPEHQFHQTSATSDTTTRARVTIRPLAHGHEAVLTLLPPRHGERVIREDDEDCRGLADALALAFVMLVAPNSAPSAAASGKASSPDLREATPSPSDTDEPATKTTPALQQLARAPQRVPERRSRVPVFRAGLGASALGGFGLLTEPALGAGGELELSHERGWALSLQGLRLWSLPAEAEGGSVTLTLWGLLGGACYRARLSELASFDACLRFGVGSQQASVRGFASPHSGHYPWQVLVPSVGYRHHLFGSGKLVSGFARLGLVNQLRPQSFSVRRADGSEDPVPIAGAPRFGVMADIGLMFGTGLF